MSSANPAPTLARCTARLDWASSEINAIDDATRLWIAHDDDALVMDVEYHAIADVHVYYRRLGRVPAEIEIRVASVLHHLVATLDELVNQLVRVNGAVPNDGHGKGGRANGFPIRSRPPKTSFADVTQDKLANVRPEHRAIIEACQPYQWSHPDRHPLARLTDLNNADKHQTLIAASLSDKSGDEKPIMASEDSTIEIVDSHSFAGADAGRSASAVAGWVQFNVPGCHDEIRVLFPSAGQTCFTLTGEPVGVLRVYELTVRSIVDAFEGAFDGASVSSFSLTPDDVQTAYNAWRQDHPELTYHADFVRLTQLLESLTGPPNTSELRLAAEIAHLTGRLLRVPAMEQHGAMLRRIESAFSARADEARAAWIAGAIADTFGVPPNDYA